MRRRRKWSYSPSTGHKLVLLVTDEDGRARYSNSLLGERVEGKRSEIAKLVGADRVDWAVSQLKGIRATVKPGWPNPCKAGPHEDAIPGGVQR